MMKDKKLTNGRLMPQPGFGTFLTPDGEICVNSVRTAIEKGYKHVDTAAVYGNEKSVGEGIRESGKQREEIFLTSKLWNTERGYDTTLRAFEKTISDLGTDYLDLYLIHWPANRKQFGDKADRLNIDTWRAFERLYEEGCIKSIGVSNFMPHHLEPLLEVANVMPMVDQIEYHPGFMQPEAVNYCQQKGIVVQAWSPLGRGIILFDELLTGLAEKYGHTVAQTVIRWVMQHDIVPLVKSVTPSRIEENLQVFDFQISEEDMALIDKMSSSRVGSDPDEATF